MNKEFSFLLPDTQRASEIKEAEPASDGVTDRNVLSDSDIEALLRQDQPNDISQLPSEEQPTETKQTYIYLQ